MPRYFFHVHDGQASPDLEGTELPDLEAARRQAVDTAGLTLRESQARPREGLPWRMEVADGSGAILFVLHVSIQPPPPRET
ncbi:DUF6894 family protein [Muricoccus radiodurans]|uniref:DUF6894 family protein n=1 Tax=Muricoccus radiodurans TaxID=2231721 RepID=UPI003CF7DFC1